MAGLYRRIHVPALPQLRTLTSYVERWAADLDALPRDAPIPRRMREQCVSLARDLVADPASVGVIIHGDLHYQNVLAGDREPWLVIDPKPMSGDPHYEPAPMLWNRCGRASSAATSARAAAAPLPHARRRRRASTRTAPATGSSSGWCSTPRGPSSTATPTTEWLTMCVTIAKAVQE